MLSDELLDACVAQAKATLCVERHRALVVKFPHSEIIYDALRQAEEKLARTSKAAFMATFAPHHCANGAHWWNTGEVSRAT